MSLPQSLSDNMSLPLIGAPLFIISNPDLVIAQCRAGIIGSFPALNARPESLLDDWLFQIKEELASDTERPSDTPVAPFAVNQICHPSNKRLEHDVRLCVKHQVPIVITSLSPPAEIVQAVHSYGGLVFHDVINVRHAQKAAEQGVDGLILVAAGAGGHAGPLSPFALVQEVRQWFEGTVILSGAIASGQAIAASLAMGADLAYSGTRFIATKEANAQPEYKQMLVDSAANDIIYSSLFTGIHGNYLKPSISRAGLDPNNLPEGDKDLMDFEKLSGGSKAWKDIWGAGQGLGAIDSVEDTASVVEGLSREFHQTIQELAQSNWSKK
jgi:nitronate monooxygenase